MFWDFFCDLCTSIDKKPNTVCRELGFSNATATHWKNGTIPNGEALIKLSNYFGVSTDFLLGLQKTMEIGVDFGNAFTTIAAPADRMREALNQLSDEHLAELENYLDYLLWKQDQESASSK